MVSPLKESALVSALAALKPAPLSSAVSVVEQPAMNAVDRLIAQVIESL